MIDASLDSPGSTPLATTAPRIGADVARVQPDLPVQASDLPPVTATAPPVTATAVEERRTILVDGFNVLHAVLLAEDRESGWWRRAMRERLLRRVAEWPRRADEIWVAFDGAEPSWSVWAEPVARIVGPGDAGGTDSRRRGRDPALANPAEDAVVPRAIVHSVYVESADDWIVRRARRTERPEWTRVVTADRQVAGRARSAGCEVWTPWAFMARCAPSDDG